MDESVGTGKQCQRGEDMGETVEEVRQRGAEGACEGGTKAARILRSQLSLVCGWGLPGSSKRSTRQRNRIIDEFVEGVGLGKA